jgi:hypothetical protein
MLFVYPQFLWALLALAIPLLVHLFNFRRIRKVYFPNVAWLQEVQTSTRSVRRFKRLLVMSARMLALAALVLAFAQPYLPKGEAATQGSSRPLVSIYLDNSYSMQSEIGNESLISRASQTLEKLLATLPEASRIQLITNGFENKEQFVISPQEAADRLTELRFAPQFRTLDEVLARQHKLLQKEAGAADKPWVFLLTDFQKSTLKSLDQLPLDSNYRYFLVPFTPSVRTNLSIDSVWLDNPFLKANESNKLQVRIHNSGEERYEDLILKLYVADRQISTANVSIEAQQTTQTYFNFTMKGEQGWQAAKISFEDFPVTFDNEYFFVLNAAPAVRIIHLTQQNNSPYIQRVFANESLFKLQTLSANNLDFKQMDLADLVVIDELTQLDGALATALKAFVQRGGSLLMFPPAAPDPSWASLTSALTGADIQLVPPKRTNNRGSGENTQEVSAQLAAPNINNPFYDGVFERAPEQMDMPQAQAVLSWKRYQQLILGFKNNNPFLTEWRTGQGKVYLCAAPLQAKYSTFAKHALFVPVMYTIATKSKTGNERLAYTFQENNISLALDNPPAQQVYHLRQDSIQFTPAQRLVDNVLMLEMPEEIQTPGHYQLYAGNKLIRLLAFNTDKAESEMSFYDKEVIQAYFKENKKVEVYEGETAETRLADTFKQRNLRQELWKTMLLIALLALALEIAFIRLL